MRHTLLLLVLCSPVVAAGADAQSTGPTPLMLQQQFRSAPGPGIAAGTVSAAGGDTSNTIATAGIPGAIARRWADRLIERIDVADFGTTADATTAYLSQAAPAASTVLAIGTGPAPAIGRIVVGYGVPAGTTVTSVAGTAGVVSIGLSAATTATASVGEQLDFGTHDDVPAFAAALAAANAPAQIYVPPGRYYMTGYVGNKPGITWITEGASFAQLGGIAEQGDQSIMQQAGGAALEVVKRMVSTTGEEGIFLPVTADPTQATGGYQKNALHIVLTQNDTSMYAFRGDAVTATHDLVGVSVQSHCPAANKRCSLFGSNWINFLEAGSDGPSTANETEILDSRAAGVPEMDSWDNVGAVDYIVGGTSPITNVMTIQGNAGNGPGTYNGIVVRTGSVGSRLLVERTAGAQDPTGVVHSHIDTMWLGADGSVFAQSLHVGGGPATSDVLPAVGMAVDSGGNVLATSLTVSGSAQIGGGVIAAGSGSAMLAPTSCGTTIRDTGSVAHTYTVPLGLQIGCRIGVIQTGAGIVTIAGSTGVTIESYNGLVRSGGQFARLEILVDSTGSALLSGQLQ